MISKTRRRCIAVVAALLCADNRLCAGESRHPRAEGRVCARRLQALRGYIPDPTRVEQCLRQNKSDLSDACRSVFEQSAGPVASRSK